MAVMRDDTPYHQRPAGEVAREQACMRSIFAQAPEVDLVWEAFGGLGKTAQVIRQRFPEADLLASDLDAQCVEEYNSLMIGTCTQADAREHFETLKLPERWGASLDFNRFTIRDLVDLSRPRWKADLIDRVVEARPMFLELTDSSRPYLHLNWQNYGLERNDPALYIHELMREVRERWHLQFKVWSGHSRANYIMFLRS